MTTKIQLRRGTAVEWSSANPILSEGEMGIESDTLTYKIGNGTLAWNSLSYTGLSPSVGSVNILAGIEPSTPSAGRISLYAKSIAGRVLPAFKGPSGIDTSLQPNLAENGFYLIVPGTTTIMNTLGGPAVTAVGTLSHPALASTNLVTQTSRAQIVSASTANSVSEVRSTFARSWRGNAAGLGGFLFRARFAITSSVANSQFFIGLSNSTSAFITTQTPSALTEVVGLGFDTADANFQIMHNDAAGTASKVNLGSTFVKGVTDTIYEVNFFAAPNSSSIGYTVIDFKNSYATSGTLTTELPTNTAFLAPHAYLNNGGTAAAVTLQLMRIYIESDY